MESKFIIIIININVRFFVALKYSALLIIMHVNPEDLNTHTRNILGEEMGIRGLTRLLCTNAPEAFRHIEVGLPYYAGKRIAFDASLFIYQVMTVSDTSSSSNGPWANLVSRLVKILDARIDPVFVFDGNPPSAKAPLLAKRRETASLQKGYRLNGKDIKACKRLLTSIGVPFVEAPSEAEAQCARMCMDGLVYGVATEDMDALAFGTPILIRNIFGSSAVAGMSPTMKHCITEIHLNKAVKDLELESMEQFVDLCIMCGCDYAGTIPGIGPVRALKGIREHGNIDGVLAAVMPMSGGRITHDKLKSFTYQDARKLFLSPMVTPVSEMSPIRRVLPNISELTTVLRDDMNITDDKKIQRLTAKIKKLFPGCGGSVSLTPSPASNSPSPLLVLDSPKQTTIESFFISKAKKLAQAQQAGRT